MMLILTLALLLCEARAACRYLSTIGSAAPDGRGLCLSRSSTLPCESIG